MSDGPFLLPIDAEYPPAFFAALAYYPWPQSSPSDTFLREIPLSQSEVTEAASGETNTPRREPSLLPVIQCDSSGNLGPHEYLLPTKNFYTVLRVIDGGRR